MSALGQKRTFPGVQPMLLYPQKRTLLRVTGMSALCQKRTFAASSDHLVAAKIGKPMRKIEPRGLAGDAVSSPECRTMIIRQRASPNPIPWDFVVTNASKMLSA